MKKSDTSYMSNRDRNIWKAIEKLEVTADNLFKEVDKTVAEINRISKEINKLSKKKT